MTNKLTLLRRYEPGEIIGPAGVAIERMATDEEVKEAYRKPGRWSYVIRDPSGEIAGSGDDDTQQACLVAALNNVARVAVEITNAADWPYHPIYPFDDDSWRFLLWPPEV
jgi:hypothetical protein